VLEVDHKMIEFECPKCSAKLQAPDDAAGKMATCPKCKEQITIPSA